MANHFFQRPLWWLAGANADILTKPECQTDRMKYSTLGMTVLFTAMMASLSGGYALFAVFGSPAISAAFGAFWGSIIMTMDRAFLITSTKETGLGGKLKVAIPRLALAAVLGLVISKPLELRLFQAEIAKRLAIEFQDKSLDGRKLQSLETQRKQLKTEVESARQQWQSQYDTAVSEAQGMQGTGNPGRGDVYDLKKQQADSTKTVLDEKAAALAKLESEIHTLKQKLDRGTQALEAGRASLLDQLGALSHLAQEDRTLEIVIHAITLLFITVEVTPVLIKLMAKPGVYDFLLDAIDRQVYKAEQLKLADLTEQREQHFLARRQLRKVMQDRTLQMNQDVLDTQYTAAMQQMLERPAYAQVLEQVMNTMQQSVGATLMAEAQRTQICDPEAVGPILQSVQTEMLHQGVSQEADRAHHQEQINGILNGFKMLEDFVTKATQNITPQSNPEVNPGSLSS